MRKSEARDVADAGNDGYFGFQAGPVVKICGLTQIEDVFAALDSGAWALGFVFAPSPRQVSAERVARLLAQVRRLRQARRALAVGVFGDIAPSEIARLTEAVGLDAVQLHGEKAPHAVEVREAIGRSVVIIRAVAVKPDETDAGRLAARIREARPGTDIVLLDSKTGRQFGGTGTPFSWDLAREASDGLPLLVAGGIGPANAADALRRSGAWGVDVSSGVESSPGIKDARSMRELMAEVKGSTT
ncbi:MAG: phosphoribosylanthranilate isomerase [Actinobacteria bacterium]|nr:phosphoribosylanthranilate isomerase [Actinomycetota bacterium]